LARFSKQLTSAMGAATISYHPSSPTPPIISGGVVYFASSSSLYAVGPAGILWQNGPNKRVDDTSVGSPAIGQNGSVYSMWSHFDGTATLVRFDRTLGTKLAEAPYSRYATEPMIDSTTRIRAGRYENQGSSIETGAYTTWDSALNTISAGTGDYTTGRAALMPDGVSTVRIGKTAFQRNWLSFRGARTWDLDSHSLPNMPYFTTVPTVDASGDIYIGTSNSIVRINQTGSVLSSYYIGEPVIAQPVLSSNGALYVALSWGQVLAFGGSSVGAPKLVASNDPGGRLFAQFAYVPHGSGAGYVTADVTFENTTGTWYEMNVLFDQPSSTALAPVNITSQQIPYAFVIGPFQKVKFSGIRFLTGQYLHLSASRTSVAATTMVAIDIIMRGIFGAAFPTSFSGVISLHQEELLALITAGNQCSRTALAIGLCAGFAKYACVTEQVAAYAGCVLSDPKSRAAAQHLITVLFGRGSGERWVALGARRVGQLINLLNRVPKVIVLTDQYFNSPTDGFVRIEAR
jgi:hypothetical protein